MKITLHGAAREVTGSCTLIETEKSRVLVDCGLFQGNGDSRERNAEPFPFDPASLDAVILTHAHIDHIGRIPKLVRQGFSGRIFATHPTRMLARLMLRDAANVMRDEARKGGHEPLYAKADVGAAFDAMHGVDYGTDIRLSSDAVCRLRDAGHIFGSAFIEIDVGGARLVCSGDLGNDYVPILRQSERFDRADIVLCESTYGGRSHEPPEERMRRLEQAVRSAADRKGVLLIPAFSLERTQELLYELNFLVENGRVPAIPVFLDSPLAIKVLPVYREFPEYYNREAQSLKASGDDFFKFQGLTVIKGAEASRGIVNTPPPKAIIAGSGMMHGGRIMRHLAEYLGDAGTTLLIVGYQARGTIGRAIREGAARVTVEGQTIEVKAKVETIEAYSAHADGAKLVRWITGGAMKPARVLCNHGEPEAAEALIETLGREHGIEASAPAAGESVNFS